MTAAPMIDPARFVHEQLAQASPDLLRQMLTTFINTLTSVAQCNEARTFGEEPSDGDSTIAEGVRRRSPGDGHVESSVRDR